MRFFRTSVLVRERTFLTEARIETLEELHARLGDSFFAPRIGPDHKPIGYIDILGFVPG